MATIRVPYPGDSDGGSFRGATPIGHFAGHYRSEVGSEILKIVLTHKPWLVPVAMFEYEVCKLLAHI